uniref:Uncharacterized protein n=1 Tax=Caldiarchaeum subterraneum TaxID=311458 RepID=E6N8W7_CALS0|nr:hypothetical protein HGMM_F05B08C18 [Candidatus Caldarchaeum subterraneum]
MKGLAATLTSLAVLLILGGVVARPAFEGIPPLGFQTAVLAVMLTALAAVVTPLSSALGGSTVMPPMGTTLHLGLWPLFTWFLAGLTVALITRRARESVIPPLIASTLTYLLVLGLSIYVLPRVPGAMSWEVYLTALAKQIIIDGPLDFAFLFALPLFTAMISAGFLEALTPKKQVYRVNRPRRFWEWSEEE